MVEFTSISNLLTQILIGIFVGVFLLILGFFFKRKQGINLFNEYQQFFQNNNFEEANKGFDEILRSYKFYINNLLLGEIYSTKLKIVLATKASEEENLKSAIIFGEKSLKYFSTRHYPIRYLFCEVIKSIELRMSC